MPPTDFMVAKWRTGKHVGPNKPTQVVRIQRGLMDRTYMPFTLLDGTQQDFGEISGSTHNDRPWQAFWRATGGWIDVPNVSEVTIEQGFDANGVATATITLQNVVMQRIIGAAGMFTAIRRGYMSPWLGFTALGRPFTNQQVNEWYDVLNGGYRIKIWQGYGTQVEPEFVGLVDDTDIRVGPDVITLTSRDFGQLLTDQRVFGSVKAKELRSPVTFADSKDADDTTKISAGAVASTSDPSYPARNVTRPDDTYWRSNAHPTSDATEWIEIHLPKGRYEDFYLDPKYAGMEAWVSVYLRNKGLGGKSATINGTAHDNGWVSGGGIVPGTNGGHVAARHIPNMGSQPLKRELGFSMNCGDDTVLRVSFRNLPRGSDGNHRAGVTRLVAYKRKRKPELKGKKWVFVNDAADIVKWVLMWAGFKEWEVEPFGVNIKDPMVFHQSDYLIDIINHMKEQANYVFYIRRPTENEGSIGVPVFRRASATDAPPLGMVDIRDTNVLTGLETRFSKESLAYIIRYRGKMTKDGKALGEDTTTRVMASYWPPWSGAHRSVATGAYTPGMTNRLAGVIKHVIHTDKLLETADECMMACIQTAIQEALAAYTGNVQIPGLPGVDLDAQVSVIDAATGTNQRLWIGHRNSSFTTGESGGFTMTLSGAMIDTPDLQILAQDYLALLRKVARQ